MNGGRREPDPERLWFWGIAGAYTGMLVGPAGWVSAYLASDASGLSSWVLGAVGCSALALAVPVCAAIGVLLGYLTGRP